MIAIKRFAKVAWCICLAFASSVAWAELPAAELPTTGQSTTTDLLNYQTTSESDGPDAPEPTFLVSELTRPGQPSWPGGDQITPLPSPLDPTPTPATPNPARRRSIPVALDAQWHGQVDDVTFANYGARLTVPLLFMAHRPPPMISFGFGYTNIGTPASFDLPRDYYDYSLNASWMRKWNDRWTVRMMIGGAFATDGQNTSNDAAQIRGGLFAIYDPNEYWTWTFGVLALGRNDLPVIPAIGAVWTPNPCWEIDLTMPRPRVTYLLYDTGTRQQRVYTSLGLSGSTWGIERPSGAQDQLTYSDWRFTVGWESSPTRPPGARYVPGRVFSVEAGYVFSREFELEDADTSIGIGATWMLRTRFRF